MNRAKSYSITLAVLLLVAVLVVSSFGTGQAKGRVGLQAERVPDVRVVNTTAEPVPVLTRGTTNIAGSVSVTNTPTVNVAPGASFGISPSSNAVQVANPELVTISGYLVDLP